MERLNRNTLEKSNYDGFVLGDAPERVLQFGEGNFLRAFVDYFFDVLNEKEGFNGKIAMVQPIEQGLTDMINEQDGVYTLYLRGSENGEAVMKKRVITSVSRCINPYRDFDVFMDCAKNPDLKYLVSNTTEAGIAYSDKDKFDDAPAKSFPAKLTRFMYERFKIFEGKPGSGFVILSCELIDNNGKELLNCVEKYIKLWNLSDEFLKWIREENIFCSTLVDRIVTGYPRTEADKFNAENGYVDNLLDTGEIFGFWVIEGPQKIREMLPFEKAGLPVIVVDDVTPYKKRKVRILNGTHTSMTPASMLAGEEIVRNCMENEVISGYVNTLIYDEIIPILTLPKEELLEFAGAVADRFKNPYIDHRLTDISLNSISKWRARVMPSLLEYIEKFNKLPECLSFSLAGLLRFYKGKEKDGNFVGEANGKEYAIRDDRDICAYFAALPWEDVKKTVDTALSNVELWGRDLTEVAGLADKVADFISKIDEVGAKDVMRSII